MYVTTSNGHTCSTTEVDIYVNKLDMTVTAHILEDSPTLLSLGKLCQEDGYDYFWKRYTDQPYLEKENGDKVYLDVELNVPIILNTKIGRKVPAGVNRELD